ncbi:hypothetical protein [Cellulomonas alba]|uniref:Uncharacterized protein n=1 Tax=Cellulomonas alba TaxID=3053467 RepID=A0ABT7SKB8_9CELL|nr:hypothetical protein [Cellulomonas alba]MDM7856623.1 hypothetical protein [Cellulomonas alba]
MQAYRLQEVLREIESADLDAQMRSRLAEDTALTRQWRASFDRYEQHDPERPLRVPTASLWMQQTAEMHFLLVAVNNVSRAVDRLPADVRAEIGNQDVAGLLRNITEHYDEEWGPSARNLAENHPNIKAGLVAFDKRDAAIGGPDGVALSDIRIWLVQVTESLTGCLVNAGVTPPHDLNASLVDGDDDLPWPPERLRFHWSIPRVPEEQWPREKMSEEMATLWWRLHGIRFHEDAGDDEGDED